MALAHMRGPLAVAFVVLSVGLLMVACGASVGKGEKGASPDQDPHVGIDVGDRAPSFTVTSVDGESATLEGLLAQKRPFLLYFFTSW